MQLLSKAISDILLGDTDITNVTGTGNIWHAKIPQQTTSGSTEPQSISIYFYTYAVTPNDTKSGRSDLDTHMVRVHISGTDDHQLNQVARYVRLALDRIDPGEYSGIPIQGSRFLNSYYEPEGNYQLELQEWRLEFQFRVIDPDARVPGGLTPSWSAPSWYYSESEQIWPYSKWLNGETIYWRTWALEDGDNDTQPLDGLTDSIVSQIIDARYIGYLTISGIWTTGSGIELTNHGGTYELFVAAGTETNYITVFYTKA
jgi:hypothetical protein